MNFDSVVQVVAFQESLLNAFRAAYREAKDYEWLLDFPLSGELMVEGVRWDFIKHGAGVRFVRRGFEPHVVLDLHRHFGHPRVIDQWRMSQFIESLGNPLTKERVAELLEEMCKAGDLIHLGNGEYRLEPKAITDGSGGMSAKRQR
jgi:uncharacterized protein DUF6896